MRFRALWERRRSTARIPKWPQGYGDIWTWTAIDAYPKADRLLYGGSAWPGMGLGLYGGRSIAGRLITAGVLLRI
jgi:hypothetical protein